MASTQQTKVFTIQIKGVTQESKKIAQLDYNLRELAKRRDELQKKQKSGQALNTREKLELAAIGQESRNLSVTKNELMKTERARAKVEQLEAGSMAKLRGETALLRAEANNLNLKTAEGKKRFEEIRKQMDDNTKQIRDFDREMSGSSTLVGEYEKGFTAAFAKVGVAIAGVVAALRSLKRVAETVMDFAQFETGITNVQTLLEETDYTLANKTIKLMGQYGLAVDDTSKSLFDAVSAGVPASESMDFMATAAGLAVGGVTDLSIAVDGMTSVLNGYGKSYNEANQVASAFFSAQKFGKTTVGELAQEIGMLVPVGRQLDVGYQELLSTYAVLTKQGIKTNLATTALRATMTALMKPSKDAAETFDRLGIAYGATAIKQRGFFNTLVDIAKAIEGGDAELTDLIPNVRALVAAGALGTRQLKEFDEILKVVNEDYGENSSLARAVAMQQETITKSMDRVKAKIHEGKLALGEFLAPAVKGFADLIAPIETTSDRLIQQRGELNILVQELRNNWEVEEDRKATMEEIIQKYPDFLRGLNVEKVTLEEINQRLQVTNEQYLAKIKLTLAEEEARERGVKIAELENKLDVNKEKFQERAIKLVTKYNGDLSKLTGSIGEQRKYIELLMIARKADAGEILSQGMIMEGLEKRISWLNFRLGNQTTKFNEAADAVSALRTEYEELTKTFDFTITGGETGGETGEETGGGGGTATAPPTLPVETLDEVDIDDELRSEYEARREWAALMGEAMALAYEIEEAAAIRLKKTKEDFRKKDVEDEKKAQGQRMAIISSANSTIAALSSALQASNNRRMQEELKNAGDNEQEKEKIRRKYAKKNQSIAIGEAIIRSGLAVLNAMNTQPFIPMGLIAAAMAVIMAGIQIANIKSQKFAKGGRVEGGMKIVPTPQGDDTLIVARQGEAVLTERQQASIGIPALRAAGVPGFATGGVVGGSNIQQSGGDTIDINALGRTIADQINSIDIRLDVNKVNKKQGELEVINEAKEI